MNWMNPIAKDRTCLRCCAREDTAALPSAGTVVGPFGPPMPRRLSGSRAWWRSWAVSPGEYDHEGVIALHGEDFSGPCRESERNVAEGRPDVLLVREFHGAQRVANAPTATASIGTIAIA